MKLRLALLLVLFAACAGPFVPPTIPSVDDAARNYNNDARWGRWQEAASAVEPDQRAAFLRLLDAKDHPFKFTDVDVVNSKPMSDDGTEVEILATVQFYQLPSVQERSVRQVQKWRYDVLEKQWFVAPDLSVLRDDVSSGGPARR